MVVFIIMVVNRDSADFSNQIERIDAGYSLLHTGNGRQFSTKCRYAGRFQQTHPHFIFQVGQYSRGTHPLSLLFVPGRLEIVEEELLCSRLHAELAVPLHYLLCLCRAEVVRLVLMQGPHGLGIKLFVVRGRTHIDGACEFYPQETSIARGIS